LTDFVLLTCEHGGNRVPSEFARLFRRHRVLLASHRGYDPGALELARTCARRLKAPLHFATVTRLLVELNRSVRHPSLFSVATRSLPAIERESLLEKHYFPFRNRVAADIEAAIERGARVIHLSFHTFTPNLDGDVRRADIGLLYDPRRAGETAFCSLLKSAINNRRPDLIVRKNYPYTGKSDGFTTTLRKKWDAAAYLGIELEVNQRWPLGDRPAWRRLQRDLAGGLAAAIGPKPTC
jgi:predicted N-formylglutamate amidohydrolase